MPHSLLEDVRAAARAALPIMLGYVTIGLPCGIMSAEAGLTPAMVFLLSCTFYSGAGQFMMSSLWLAGASVAQMAASVSLVSTRQMLYSAALSPYVATAPRPLAALFAATVTDESFGVNLDAFASDAGWTCERATLVNLMSMTSWAVANAVGAAVGAALAIPVAIMSFAMTSIFICLLVGQAWRARTVVVVAVTVVAVVAAKLLGLGSLAVLVGAVVGVVAGLAFGAAGRAQGGEKR